MRKKKSDLLFELYETVAVQIEMHHAHQSVNSLCQYLQFTYSLHSIGYQKKKTHTTLHTGHLIFFCSLSHFIHTMFVDLLWWWLFCFFFWFFFFFTGTGFGCRSDQLFLLQSKSCLWFMLLNAAENSLSIQSTLPWMQSNEHIHTINNQ